MTEHTPGPWYHERSKYEGDRIVGATRETMVVYRAQDPHTYYDIVDIPNEADASLIAAAPDLLDALEAAVSRLEAYMSVNGAHKYIDETLSPYRAAIAKALGQ